MTPSLLSVVGVQQAKARRVLISGRQVLTAIHKTSVQGPVPVGPLGLVEDEQADPTVHGGLEKAVYAYPLEHYDFWRNARVAAGVADIDTQLNPGALGENLTLQGLLEADVWIGDVLQFDNLTLRVTQPREPCFKFNAAMGFKPAAKAMAHSGHCGFYLAVDTPGTVQAGERFVLIPGSRQTRISERFHTLMFKQRGSS
jgi:MOSC domain-containing protein YiiM